MLKIAVVMATLAIAISPISAAEEKDEGGRIDDLCLVLNFTLI